MELIDNINRLLGDDLKQASKPGARLKVAASCFSMYALEALKAELEQVDGPGGQAEFTRDELGAPAACRHTRHLHWAQRQAVVRQRCLAQVKALDQRARGSWG